MDALVTAFVASSRFTRLRPESQRSYRGIMDRLRTEHGTKTIANLQPRHIRMMLDKRADTPTAANALRNVLRQLMRYAVALDWRSDNPVDGVEKVRHRTDGHHAWTESEIHAFEGFHPAGSRARLALALLLYTGQRRGDVVKMGPGNLRTGERNGKPATVLDLIQGKTGKNLTLPVLPLLADALALAPPGTTFIQGATGRPMTPEGFSNWFVEAAREAGLPKGCSPHGLRKAAARRLAQAGCSTHQIAAWTGHASLGEVQRYSQSVEQESLAWAGAERLGLARTGEPMRE
ncbi:tyrosine-type recombinase/integrase [Pararoseomonas sp. SCSIO 73927]|uniref:tyrosine-type recombinase/integrase n=1 Tax=Pararoseomonas sp. SCSIO 73927 TaxID=3114537 RepID=UPI0030D49347